MNHPPYDAATVVCIGNNSDTVRGLCSRLKSCGYRAIAIITDINPDCTLPLISTLTPQAIIVSDDLPGMSAASFAESLKRIHPAVRILTSADGLILDKRAPGHVDSQGMGDFGRDVLVELSS